MHDFGDAVYKGDPELIEISKRINNKVRPGPLTAEERWNIEPPEGITLTAPCKGIIKGLQPRPNDIKLQQLVSIPSSSGYFCSIPYPMVLELLRDDGRFLAWNPFTDHALWKAMTKNARPEHVKLFRVQHLNFNWVPETDRSPVQPFRDVCRSILDGSLRIPEVHYRPRIRNPVGARRGKKKVLPNAK